PPHCYHISLHDALPISITTCQFPAVSVSALYSLAQKATVNWVPGSDRPQILTGAFRCRTIPSLNKGDSSNFFCAGVFFCRAIKGDRKSTRLNSSHVKIS